MSYGMLERINSVKTIGEKEVREINVIVSGRLGRNVPYVSIAEKNGTIYSPQLIEKDGKYNSANGAPIYKVVRSGKGFTYVKEEDLLPIEMKDEANSITWSIAVSRGSKTEWFSFVAFGEVAAQLALYYDKGEEVMAILIEKEEIVPTSGKSVKKYTLSKIQSIDRKSKKQVVAKEEQSMEDEKQVVGESNTAFQEVEDEEIPF